MYTVVKGIYEKGHLILLEPAPDVERAEVLVTFLEESDKIPLRRKRVFGGSKHIGGRIPDDFNDPLDDLQEYM